ncbi:TetR/AcrR family transcriptional regulator [Gordonia sp. NPDC003376]
MAYTSADQRRQDLIAAAFRVMAEKGVASTSTRAICTEAGVPQSFFHYCFRHKEELLRELTHTVVAQMLESAFASAADLAPSDAADGLEASLAQVFTGLLQAAVDAPERQLVLYELTTTVLRDPDLAELARWQYEQYYASSSNLLAELADRHGIDWTLPMPIMARMFTTDIDGLILNWLADRDTDQARQLVATFARQFAALTNEKG